jgi:hypothetical protein
MTDNISNPIYRDGKDLDIIYNPESENMPNVRIQSNMEFKDIYPRTKASVSASNILGMNSWCRLFFGGFEKPPISVGKIFPTLGRGEDIQITIIKDGIVIDKEKILLRIEMWRGWHVVLFQSTGLERGVYNIQVDGFVRGNPSSLKDIFQLEPMDITSYLIGMCRNKLFDHITGFDRHINLWEEAYRWNDTMIWDELEASRRRINIYKATPENSRGYTWNNFPEDLITPLNLLTCGNLLANRQIKEIDDAHVADLDIQVKYERDYTPLGENLIKQAENILELSMKVIKPHGAAGRGHVLRFMEPYAFMALLPFTTGLFMV